MTRSTLLLFSCIFFTQLSAQNLTGRWQGSFIANGDALINNYTYELVIKENASHQITAQTITKKGDQFYASAFAKGSHSLRTQLVQIDETSFDQIKIANELEACLMSNFLTYKNMDGHEILEGSYMSTSVNGKRNCGSGKVFLEKITSVLSVKNTKVENKKTDTHTHEDGSEHVNHDATPEVAPEQEVFEIESDSLTVENDSLKSEHETEHSHEDGHGHKH